MKTTPKSDWFLKMESDRIFKPERYGDIIMAFHAASEWLKRHEYDLPSFQSPRVWIEFSKERGGYVFRPNMDYVPSLNENWKCVVENDTN